MIWLIIALISGLIYRIEIAAALPFIYLLARRNKDLALVSFFLYASLLPSQLSLPELLSIETLRASISVGIPSVMFLDEILRVYEPIKRKYLLLIPLALFGFLSDFFLISSVIVLIMAEMKFSRILKTLKSYPMIIFILTLLLPSILLWRMNALYFENQVALVGGTIILAFLLLQNAEKVDLFESSEKRD